MNDCLAELDRFFINTTHKMLIFIIITRLTHIQNTHIRAKSSLITPSIDGVSVQVCALMQNENST